MSAQPDAPGPDTGSYEVIHLGGQAAVVVPVADFLRLRALEKAATPAELEDAEADMGLASSLLPSDLEISQARGGNDPSAPRPGAASAPAAPQRRSAGSSASGATRTVLVSPCARTDRHTEIVLASRSTWSHVSARASSDRTRSAGTPR